MSVLKDLKKFYTAFKYEKGNIGYSYKGVPIYYFAVRKSLSPVLLVQYGMHAREYITTYLAIKQIKDFVLFGKFGTVYFIPAVNPDGIKIAETVNPLYKANYNGVDLNVNFDARWGTGIFNVRERGAENCIGEFPFSEIESRALRDFTLLVKPDMTVSYHSKGEEIYYKFFQGEERLKRDYLFAKTVSDCTGYCIKDTLGSSGGYKDWCVESLKIPAITIEVGSDLLSHPIKKRSLPEIYDKNKKVIENLLERLKEING